MPYKVVKDATPTGAISTYADLINASGEIAGGGFKTGGTDRMGVIWSKTGAATILPSLGSDWNVVSVAGINASEVTAGVEENSTLNLSDAVLWTAGATTPTILNDAGGLGLSQANAIDNVGDTVGSWESSSGQEAVYWNAAG